jgi:hypothetical protein
MNGPDVTKDYSRIANDKSWSKINAFGNKVVKDQMEPYKGAVGSKMNRIDHNGPKAVPYKGPRGRDYVGISA